jgi:hypothetical protein
MKVGIKEKPTIQALNEISRKYPFAAALLTYAIVERVLKEYIIKNRKNRSLLDYSYSKPSDQKISLQNYYRCKKKDFIRLFVKRIALGDAQIIVSANGKRDYATARNNLMHSNSFLLEERKYSKAKRHTIHQQSYKEASGHLEFVINNFSDFKVRVNMNNHEIIVLTK